MDHYLASKGFQHPVNQYGLRQAYEPFNGYEPFGTGTASLIVPVMDIDGAIHSLQFIAPDGQKRFYPGGKLKGHFYAIGLFDKPVKILITEGIATALTLYEDIGFPVIVAFNCGNLAAVAEAIRWKYADVDILICGDDDHTTEGNPGRTKAMEAAARCGGDWVLPDFSGLLRGPKDSDFNDLRRLQEACDE
jgi:putative DNA primase/helicase